MAYKRNAQLIVYEVLFQTQSNAREDIISFWKDFGLMGVIAHRWYTISLSAYLIEA
jgi:hypothetical protein